MNKKAVLLIFVSILLFSFASGIALVETRLDVADSSKPGQGVLSGSGESEGVDWWPMFHHDLNHTGYSTSKAPETNRTLWTYTTGGSGVDHSSPAVADGKVYVGSLDFKVYCLNASTGSLIWSYTTGGYVLSSPAIADDRVYLGSLDFKVYCLNASTGSLIWNYTTGNGITRSSPAVSDGKVYIGSNDGKIYALDASTGSLIWSYTTGGWTESSPAVADGKVYVGSSDSKVYCLNASTGSLIWNYTTFDKVYSSPAVADGMVYVGSYDYQIYCLNASTGSLIWNYITNKIEYSTPAVAYGKVYVGSLSTRSVYALDASTGSLIWSYTTGGYVESSPAVSDGKVYVGSCDGKVYCLNASTGSLIWNYITGGGVYSSPAVADGKVYVGSRDKKVYAFGSQEVAITSVTPSTTEAYSGQIVNITVVTRNEGSLGTFDVNTYYDLTLVGTQTVTDLPQGEEKTLTFSWNTTDVPGGDYTISANATVVPGETDIADNNFIDGKITVTSPVRIAEVIPCNQTGNPKGTFERGTIAYFKVTINSTALIPQNTLITINLYDNTSITLSVESIQGPTWPGTSTIIFGLSIPATATIGTAIVYANCYTNWPSLGGLPHCPEMPATIEITGP